MPSLLPRQLARRFLLCLSLSASACSSDSVAVGMVPCRSSFFLTSLSSPSDRYEPFLLLYRSPTLMICDDDYDCGGDDLLVLNLCLQRSPSMYKQLYRYYSLHPYQTCFPLPFIFDCGRFRASDKCTISRPCSQIFNPFCEILSNVWGPGSLNSNCAKLDSFFELLGGGLKCKQIICTCENGTRSKSITTPEDTCYYHVSVKSF